MCAVPLSLRGRLADRSPPSLQYARHAKEVNMPLPDVPVLFMKAQTALGDPFPAPTTIPRAFVKDNAADYEAELAVVIGKEGCKNVTEDEALDYVLGSARLHPFPPSANPDLVRFPATPPRTTSRPAWRSFPSPSGATASRSTVHARSVPRSCTRTRSRASPTCRSAARSTAKRCKRAASSE